MAWPKKYKPAYASYRIIKGKHYKQWSDEHSLKQCRAEYPFDHFIARTLRDGTLRIFREVPKLSKVSADTVKE